MKTFTLARASVLGAGLLMCGLLIQLAYAETIPNWRCVTMLDPSTCAEGGDSVCNASWDGTLSDCIASPTCWFCDDSSTTLPTKVCVWWETHTCTTAIGLPGFCSQTAIRRKGTCSLDVEELEEATVISCNCTWLIPQGNCSGEPNLPCIVGGGGGGGAEDD